MSDVHGRGPCTVISRSRFSMKVFGFVHILKDFFLELRITCKILKMIFVDWHCDQYFHLETSRAVINECRQT